MPVVSGTAVCLDTHSSTDEGRSSRETLPNVPAPGRCPRPAPACPTPSGLAPHRPLEQEMNQLARLLEQGWQGQLVYLCILFTRTKKMQSRAQLPPAGLHHAGPGDAEWASPKAPSAGGRVEVGRALALSGGMK